MQLLDFVFIFKKVIANQESTIQIYHLRDMQFSMSRFVKASGGLDQLVGGGAKLKLDPLVTFKLCSVFFF
jgi:hypothetical protein